MTEIIHHDDSSSGMYILLAIVIVAVLGFLLWRYMPANNTPNNGSTNINVSVPTGGASGTGY